LAGSLELEQIAEGAGVGAGEAGLGAVEDGERVAVGEPFERLGESLDGGERVVGVFFDVVDGGGEELGFDDGDAVETPFGGSHFVDQVELNGAAGLEVVGVGGEEVVEFRRVFGGEHDGGGVEAVLESVLGGAGAAGRGGGAAGFCAVGASGVGFGWHVGRVTEVGRLLRLADTEVIGNP
jgi:hypothetical protein